jgi:hypothetical protein
MTRKIVYRRTDHAGQAEAFVVIAEYQHIELDENKEEEDNG